MADIKNHYSSIEKYLTTVFALSVDAPAQSKQLKVKMELPFELLCDEKKDVLNQYGLLNPFEHGGIARPALFIIRPDGNIAYRSIDGTAQRVDLVQMLSFLAKLDERPENLLSGHAAQRWIFPSLSIFLATLRNLFVMGNFADWKHTLTFPANFILIPLKKWMRKRKKE